MVFYQGDGEMRSFINRSRAFLADESGPTATEYAVMVAVVALGLIAGAGVFEDALSAKFSEMGDQVSEINAS